MQDRDSAAEAELDSLTIAYLVGLDDPADPEGATLADLCERFPHQAQELVDFAMVHWQMKTAENDPVFQAEFEAWYAANRTVLEAQNVALLHQMFTRLRET